MPLMPSRKLLFSPYYFAICFALILTLGACQRNNKTEKVLVNPVLEDASSMKFYDMAKTDALLRSFALNTDIVKSADDWAYYYLLKGYVAFDACKPKEALTYADSAIHHSNTERFITEIKARTSLLKALVYSDYKEFDKAFFYYLNSLDFLEQSPYRYEEFIALLGIVRLKDDINQDCTHYFERAKALEETYALNRGLYLRYSARFSDDWQEILHLWKMSENYYLENNMQDRLFASYCATATYYLNRNSQDSVKRYIDLAETLAGGLELPKAKAKRKARFYYAKAWLFNNAGQQDKALDMLKKTIAHSKRLEQDDVLYISYLMESQIAELQKRYKAALYAHQAYVYHQMLFFDKSAHDKLNIINMEYEDDKNQRQLEVMSQSERIHRLSVLLVSALALVLIALLAILYLQRDKIRASLMKSHAKHSADERQLVEKNNTIENFKRCLNDPTKSYSSVYNDLKELVHTTNNEPQFYESIFENVELRQVVFSHFSTITESEYRLIVCVHLHFGRKKTAEVLGIKTESLKSKEKRLKKKLKIGTKTTLKEYILSTLSTSEE